MKPLRDLFLFLGLLLAASGLQPQSSAPTGEFIATYETPTMKITVRDRSITKTVVKQEFDNPASATPSRTTSETKSGKITADELESLKRTVRTGGFLKLQDFYGAPATERYYPYTLSVTIRAKTKTVVHRSNPSYQEKLPVAFTNLVGLLTKLGDRL